MGTQMSSKHQKCQLGIHLDLNDKVLCVYLIDLFSVFNSASALQT